jgi:hypothetical protein
MNEEAEPRKTKPHRGLKNGKKAYMVDSRKASFNGRRTFYSTEAEALAEAEQIARDKENHSALAFVELGSEQRKDAGEAIGILAEFDASLVDAARFSGSDAPKVRDYSSVSRKRCGFELRCDVKRRCGPFKRLLSG